MHVGVNGEQLPKIKIHSSTHTQTTNLEVMYVSRSLILCYHTLPILLIPSPNQTFLKLNTCNVNRQWVHFVELNYFGTLSLSNFSYFGTLPLSNLSVF